jgi:hypothetical protein
MGKTKRKAGLAKKCVAICAKFLPVEKDFLKQDFF